MADDGFGRVAFLRSVELLKPLATEAVAALAGRVEDFTLDKDQLLFRQGDPADGLYFVVSGQLIVEVEGSDGTPRTIGAVGAGDCVGEAALLLAGPRSAGVRAATPSRLLWLRGTEFEKAVESEPQLRQLLGALVARRLPSLRAVTTEIFGEIDDALRTELEHALSWVRLPRGECLFREGDTGDALYVVMQGRLRVLRERPGQRPQLIAEIGRGEPVGEMALLTRETRAFTVRAARDSDLLRLSEAGFLKLLEANPRSVLPLFRTLAQRLRAATSGPARPTRMSAVALLPLSPGVDVLGFLAPFAAELRERGSVKVLTAEGFDAVHGAGAAATSPDDARAIYLGEWLARQEAEHDFLVFVAPAAASPWTGRCLRQADRTLLLAPAADAPSPGALGALLQEEGTSAARELVLLHTAGNALPSGTARWREAVAVERHHHVRPGGSDARRVARFVSGRAVGLVLSGGGARAFAHAGVVRALAEAGVPIDFVGGVSMGSLAAACAASGFDFGRTVAAFRRCFVDTKPDKGYTLPLMSLFTPKKGERALVELFGDADIEDLWLNYFCTASNITRATLHLFRTGPLWRAMRASGSFPGLLPPVPLAGDLLVDGGLLDNLPVATAQALCPGPILASDTSRDVELAVDPTLQQLPSPVEILISHLKPGAARIEYPGLVPVLLRSLECREGAQKGAHRRAATLCFTPPVGAYGLTQVEAIDAIVDVGYRDAQQRLKTLPPELAGYVRS